MKVKFEIHLDDKMIEEYEEDFQGVDRKEKLRLRIIAINRYCESFYQGRRWKFYSIFKSRLNFPARLKRERDGIE